MTATTATDLAIVDTRPQSAQHTNAVLGAIYVPAYDLDLLVATAGMHGRIALIGDAAHPAALTAERLRGLGCSNVTVFGDYPRACADRKTGVKGRRPAHQRAFAQRVLWVLALGVPVWVYLFSAATAPIAAITMLAGIALLDGGADEPERVMAGVASK